MKENRRIEGLTQCWRLTRYLGESITDLEAFKKHLEIGQVILDTKQGVPGLQLEDVASMKSYCDVYFLFRAAVVVRDSVYNKQ
jgi:hypothetical protein